MPYSTAKMRELKVGEVGSREREVESLNLKHETRNMKPETYNHKIQLLPVQIISELRTSGFLFIDFQQHFINPAARRFKYCKCKPVDLNFFADFGNTLMMTQDKPCKGFIFIRLRKV